MTQTLKTKVLIIGAGTGGYVAGIRCGQLGLETVLVDASPGLGGTCLNVGCIPSKAIIHAAGKFETVAKAAGDGMLGITASTPAIDLSKTVEWKDGVVKKLNAGVAALLKKAKVKVIKGWAEFSDAKTCTVKTDDGDIRITAEHVILATGSEPVELPFLPFGGDVISSTEALSLSDVPKKLVVVGGGYIGLELGIAFRKLGAEVAIVEMAERILPLYDKALTDPVAKWLEKHGVELHLGARAGGFGDGKLSITTKDGEPLQLDDARKSLPVLCLHGSQDDVVPSFMGRAAHDALASQGVPVDWREYPMAHEVVAEEIDDIAAWLLQRLGG
mgnify:CR=1 FL=1